MDSIFFVLSKLVHFLIEPLNWLMILIALALLFLLLHKNHLVRRGLGIAICLGLFIGYMPTSQLAMRILEDTVPQTALTPKLLAQVGGVLILGGAIEGGPITRDRGEVTIGSAAERVTKALQLLRQHPELPFIFSGYSGRLLPQGPSEADAFKQLLQEQGLGSHPGYYENQSRNTYENMLYSKKIIDGIAEKEGVPVKPWLLITSARHMLRSMQVAHKQDLDMVPVLVDYQTSHSYSWHRFDLVEGGEQWNLFIHELVGIASYWLSGRASFLTNEKNNLRGK
jgi:uncharacterized SAM-binding protein YcdF (DUF218 family)